MIKARHYKYSSPRGVLAAACQIGLNRTMAMSKCCISVGLNKASLLGSRQHGTELEGRLQFLCLPLTCSTWDALPLILLLWLLTR